MLSKIVKQKQSLFAVRNFASINKDSRGIASIFPVSDEHGFLPNVKPLVNLPSEFKVVNELLEKMTFT